MQRGKGAKVNLIKPSRRARLIGIVIFMGLYLLCCAGCLFVTIRFINFLDGPDWPEDFCTVEDTIYQTLSENGDEWLETYFKSNEEIRTTDLINIPGDGERLLLAEYGRLYIQVVWAPRFRFGKAGYIYAADEIPRMGPDDEVTHLEGNVYCYILDDPG